MNEHASIEAGEHTITARVEMEIDGGPYPIERLADKTGIPESKFISVLFGDDEFGPVSEEAIAHAFENREYMIS